MSENNKIIASGNIPNTDLSVNINNNNSVDVISKADISDNNKVMFNNASITYISTVYDPVNNKVVIVYRNSSNSNYGTAIVGTVSGTNILFGSPVVFNSGATYYISTTYDSINNKVIITYRNDSNSSYGTAIVGSIDGLTILFGTPVVFNSSSTYYISTIYNYTNNKVIIAYQNSSNSGYGTAIVGTVSGTSISFGTPVVFNSGNTGYISTIYDSINNKVIITYRNDSNSSYGTAIVGTVNGLNISFNDPVIFNIGPTYYISTTYDIANGKIIIAYKNAGNSNYGTAIVGTVENNSITFGKPIIFNNGNTDSISITYDTANDKVIIAYRDYNNSYCGKAIVGIVDGLNILFGDTVVFNNNDTWSVSYTYDSVNDKIIIVYNNVSNLCQGTAIVYSLNKS